MKCIRRTVFVVPEEEVAVLGRLQGTLAWLDEGNPILDTNLDSIRLGLAMIRRMKATEMYEPMRETEAVEVEVA